MKIAIIGSGISGLTAAYYLRHRAELTLFEANSYIGGHTNTVPVDVDGQKLWIDTGFIVYNEATYPNFIKLLSELKVATQPTSMSFSVHDERTGLEYNGESLNALFAQRRNLLSPSFYRLIQDILRFNHVAGRVSNDQLQDLTVGEFLESHRFGRLFRENYLLPMGAAIWSCPVGTFAEFPIQFIIEFYRNHGLIRLRNRPVWRTIVGGSQQYVTAMTRDFRDRIRLNTPVVKVVRDDEGVLIFPRQGEPERFDRVIFACHSDQALRILGESATILEREVLSQFPYSRNIAVLHTDTSLLPRRRRAWASWNYRVKADSNAPASVTYQMNLLQRISHKQNFCVTLNDAESIRPECCLRTFEYHHPIFTTARSAAQSRHGELLTANHTSFCGAYWRNGFHEDGVVSALAVVKALNPDGCAPRIHGGPNPHHDSAGFRGQMPGESPAIETLA